MCGTLHHYQIQCLHYIKKAPKSIFIIIVKDLQFLKKGTDQSNYRFSRFVIKMYEI